MTESNLLDGLRRFRRTTFPPLRDRYRTLVDEGQHPGALFIGCADSRVVPSLLTDTGPGDLFVARNVGAFVPPFDPDGQNGTAAAIEYAVLALGVTDVVVCGHSHCGAVAALYDPPGDDAPNLRRWLELGRDATLDAGPGPDRDILLRTEQRSVALQIGRLLSYPAVRDRVDRGDLALHGWHYVIEDGRVDVLDLETGAFEPAVED